MPNYNEDDELAHGLEQGDPAAGDAYSDRFRRRLIKFAIKSGFTEDDAEDLAQGALAKGWEKIRSFRRGGSMIRWLAGIEHNLMLQEWEKWPTANRVPFDDVEPEDDTPKYRVARPVDAADAQQLATFFAKVQLYMTLIKNKKYVSAVQLHYMDRLSYAEVAQALGLANAETARQYVLRGLRAIREIGQGRESKQGEG
jgi:RNA polymerase sigma-70 factor (ECF subfamily)